MKDGSVIRRSPEEMTRRSVAALVRHVLDNSHLETIPGPELAQLARLWEAVRRAPEGTAEESEAWVEFRLAYCRIMGDELAPLAMHMWPRRSGALRRPPWVALGAWRHPALSHG